jgi:hypothetical protein
MSYTPLHLLVHLKALLNHKKSKKYYSKKLGVTEDEIGRLLDELRKAPSEHIPLEGVEENLKNGTKEIVVRLPDEIRTLDELIEKCKIDTDKWEIDRYVQNYWGNIEHPYWQVKAWLSKKKDQNIFQDHFISFLENYTPSSESRQFLHQKNRQPKGCLVINKQDAHYNKYDVDGDNSIDDRFDRIFQKISVIIEQAVISNYIDKVVYIVGSDEFNSEFTGTTTKGTPQEDIEGYHKSFESICSHEMDVINLLLDNVANVEVVYVAGNHDEYIGWHMINWLDAFYRNESRVSFDKSPKYRKYISYGNTAMMFNHGDVIKPSKLAGIFPMEYRENWSSHEHFYIFTGDKHHELSQDFNGIKFYQIPAFSNAKSKWDEKNGYTCTKGEVTAFMIELENGMTNIFKQHL